MKKLIASQILSSALVIFGLIGIYFFLKSTSDYINEPVDTLLWYANGLNILLSLLIAWLLSVAYHKILGIKPIALVSTTGVAIVAVFAAIIIYWSFGLTNTGHSSGGFIVDGALFLLILCEYSMIMLGSFLFTAVPTVSITSKGMKETWQVFGIFTTQSLFISMITLAMILNFK